jgi:hypothetical protein
MKRSTLAASLLLSVVMVIAFSAWLAHERESRIERVRLGMERLEVDSLLGEGKPDIMFPACGRCPAKDLQLYYRGNASPLWNQRLEDFLVICFQNGLVCDIHRTGLSAEFKTIKKKLDKLFAVTVPNRLPCSSSGAGLQQQAAATPVGFFRVPE